MSYSGESFNGWQTQPGKNTVQDFLEAALAKVALANVHTICAGRTDSGVHGIGQVVHFDSPHERPLNAWIRGVNTHLGPQISVQAAAIVAADFSARFEATSRTYLYVIARHPHRQPLLAGRATWIFQPLDVPAMRKAALSFVGEHDFSSFRSSECQAASPVRTIYSFDVFERDQFLFVRIRGNAFLHHMIRNLMGVLVQIGMGRQEINWAQEVLGARDRRSAAPTLGSDGLYFESAEYPHERLNFLERAMHPFNLWETQ